MVVRIGWLVPAAALALLAAACSGGGGEATSTVQPAVTATASASASATSSATSTAEPTASVTATASATETASASTSPTAAPDVTVYEETDEHRVRLEYPASWTRDPNYLVQFDGPDGFVQVGDLGNGGQGLDAAVDSIAHHVLMPYGSNPTLEPVVVDGVESVLIRPSDDQLPPGTPADQRQVAVVIPRGEPLHIGGQDYEYLVLYIDEGHAESILASVELLPPE
ncbi:MAG: hypothetical protein R3C39_13950 [Dehalococcoidia bacterium]